MKRFNNGGLYGGSAMAQGGGLTGATDTGYFYFFCPKCPGKYIMRILEYGVREEIPENPYNSEFKRKAKNGFILAFRLYCENCKHRILSRYPTWDCRVALMMKRRASSTRNNIMKPTYRPHNKALHRTAIPLRSIAAGELGRYASTRSESRRYHETPENHSWRCSFDVNFIR